MAHVTLHLKKDKHPTQPWTFTTDKPGPGPKGTKRTRYASFSTAKRGGLRELEAIKVGEGWACKVKGKEVPVVVTRSPKK